MVESKAPPGAGGWRKRVRPGSFLVWLTIADAFSYAFLVQGMRNVIGQDPARLGFTHGVTWIFCLLVSALMAAFCRFAQPTRPAGDPKPSPYRWVAGAWWVGVALALGASALHLAAMGYVILPQVPVGNLLFFPNVFAACLAFQFLDFLGTSPEADAPARRRFRPGLVLGLGLALVAYLGAINGLVAATSKIGGQARTYQQRFLTNDGQAKTYRRMKGELEPEIDRYRESVTRLGQLADHHSALAARYAKARDRPWDPVPPDPPNPP